MMTTLSTCKLSTTRVPLFYESNKDSQTDGFHSSGGIKKKSKELEESHGGSYLVAS